MIWKKTNFISSSTWTIWWAFAKLKRFLALLIWKNSHQQSHHGSAFKLSCIFKSSIFQYSTQFIFYDCSLLASLLKNLWARYIWHSENICGRNIYSLWSPRAGTHNSWSNSFLLINLLMIFCIFTNIRLTFWNHIDWIKLNNELLPLNKCI